MQQRGHAPRDEPVSVMCCGYGTQRTPNSVYVNLKSCRRWRNKGAVIHQPGRMGDVREIVLQIMTRPGLKNSPTPSASWRGRGGGDRFHPSVVIRRQWALVEILTGCLWRSS